MRNMLWWGLTLLLTLASAKPIGLEKNFIVKDLPGISNIPEGKIPIMHAGHLEVNAENNTNYFFWRFLKQENSSEIRHEKLTFWLNGGPGCSSMDGALMEIGPLKLSAKGELQYHEGTWMESSDLVFVDQPGGTGFSYTNSYSSELYQVAEQFSVFLQQYFHVFPHDRTKAVYIAGESYAGQYIPYIADHLLQSNLTVNLKGILIGNGWVAPDKQSLSYLPFAMEENLLDTQAGYMTNLLKQHESCQRQLNVAETVESVSVASRACEKILSKILEVTLDKDASEDKQCMNMYDYRLRDSYPSCGMNWPSDLKSVTPYLRRKDVMSCLNLKVVRKWEECNGKVSKFFSALNSRPSVHLLPDILSKIPVILFNGDKDIICNYVGTESYISDLVWGGSRGFTDPESIDWKYDGKQVGLVRSERNLTYIKVFQSSHMVPLDVPFVARGLLDIISNNFRNPDAHSIETPIYNDSGSWAFHQPYRHSRSSRGVLYLFEVTVAAIVLYGAIYFYKYYSSRPSSILVSEQRNRFTRSAKRKNKQVHWLDDSEQVDQAEEGDKSYLKKVLGKLGYGDGYKKVNSDIELQPQTENRDFLIESDEEFEH